jgi:hypothetical protein
MSHPNPNLPDTSTCADCFFSVRDTLLNNSRPLDETDMASVSSEFAGRLLVLRAALYHWRCDMSLRRFVLAIGLGFFGSHSPAWPQEPLKSSPEQRLEFARQAAAMYRLRVSRPHAPEVKLQPKPLLRWTNQVIREDDGLLFLWTEGDKGRPVAAAQFFLVENQWNHEFQSLSPNGFEAQANGPDAVSWDWAPKTAGMTFVLADNIDLPADASNQRLRQMKAIAELFTAAVDHDGNFESPEELRLLTTPVYRYSDNSEGVMDGAMFVFAQGTNPEIILLIETENDHSGWRYGFARMSSFFLRVKRDNQIVWQRERARVPTPDRSSTFFFRLHAQMDGSSEISVPAKSADAGAKP